MKRAPCSFDDEHVSLTIGTCDTIEEVEVSASNGGAIGNHIHLFTNRNQTNSTRKIYLKIKHKTKNEDPLLRPLNH